MSSALKVAEVAIAELEPRRPGKIGDTMISKRITTLYALIIAIGSLVACDDLVSSEGEAEVAEQTEKSAEQTAKSAETAKGAEQTAKGAEQTAKGAEQTAKSTSTAVDHEAASSPETARGVLTAFTACARTCSSAPGPVTNQTTCKLNCKGSAAVRYQSLAEGPEKPEKRVFHKAIARMDACLDSCGQGMSDADRETCILICNNTVATVLNE